MVMSNISQGSVATWFTCGGICYNYFVTNYIGKKVDCLKHHMRLLKDGELIW